MQNICSGCGAHNEAGADFCVFCNTYLAWDDEPEKPTVAESVMQAAQPAMPVREGIAPADVEPQADAAAAPLTRTTPPPVAPHEETPADTAGGRFRIEADQMSVDLAATGEPAVIKLLIANTSSIVDGYGIEPLDAPPWLTVHGDEVQLLPGTEEMVPLRLRIVSEALVPTQETRLTIRIKSLSQAPAHRDFSVGIVVPPLNIPVRVHAEPSMLRVKDRDSAGCDLVVDNSASNRSVHLSFSGSDPELAVTFAFDPPELDVAPSGTETVQVTATATAPEPGQAVSRSLTVTTHDGERTTDTHITLQQSTTQQVEDPLVGLEVHPSLVRVEDGAPAKIRVVADNRKGAKWTHLKFMATDPEGVVDVIWFPSSIDVPPGKAVQVEAILEAPQPKPGTEVSRSVTLKALDGPRVSTATATLVQVTSASAMSTLKLRIEPSVVRVHDSTSANVQVVVDNQRGRSVAKVVLEGADPEKAIWFNFSTPTVEVGPGQVGAAALRLDSWVPKPGQEMTREFTIAASDGQAEVKASGTFVQTSSRDAIELLSVRLDPGVLRVGPWRRGTLVARVDNRSGAQPVRIRMSGDDPENVVGFEFEPKTLTIPAGKVANSRVKVKIKRAAGDEEVTRPFTIMASDGRKDAQVDGELIQAAVAYRPFARVLLTVLGALAVILGAFRPWLGGGVKRGIDLDASTAAGLIKQSLPPDLPYYVDYVSIGLVYIVLAGLMIFGLTGQTGRLTRLVAMFAALLLVALFVAAAIAKINISPGTGAYITFIGCVVGYVGGLLRPR